MSTRDLRCDRWLPAIPETLFVATTHKQTNNHNNRGIRNDGFFNFVIEDRCESTQSKGPQSGVIDSMRVRSTTHHCYGSVKFVLKLEAEPRFKRAKPIDRRAQIIEDPSAYRTSIMCQMTAFLREAELQSSALSGQRCNWLHGEQVRCGLRHLVQALKIRGVYPK